MVKPKKGNKEIDETVDVKIAEPIAPVEKTAEVKVSETPKANIIKDWYGNIDTFYLEKKDPNYVYRFLRDEHKNLSIKTGNMLFQKGAWEIVGRDHLVEMGFKDKDFSPDGFCRRGDTILARIPKELHDEKVKHKEWKAGQPVEHVQRLVEEGDSKLSGLGHKNMRGIETKKKLGM